MKIYQEYFLNKDLNEVLDFDIKGGTKSALIFTAIIAGVKSVILLSKLALSKAERECLKFHGPGKERCILTSRIRINENKLLKLKLQLSKCSQIDKVEECKNKIENKISDTQFDIKEDIEKLKHYKENLRNEQNDIIQEWIPQMIGAIVAGIVVDKAIFIAWRSAQAIFSSSVRKCGTYNNTVTRDLCVSKQRLSALQKQLQILKTVFSTCPKQKNPEKCRYKVNLKIKELNQKIKIENDNVILYNKAAIETIKGK